MESTLTRRAAAPAVLVALFAVLACAGPALGAQAPRYSRTERVCPAPGPGEATCFALASVPARASEAGEPGVKPAAASKAALGEGPAGGYTPAQLAAAYGFDPGGEAGKGQTVAVVDAYDDPDIEADLAVFSENYGLPACTTESGCFKKVNEFGSSAPGSLPAADESGWSVEISLDVEMVHSACPKCHILLVEAENEQFTNLATAVKTAGEMGAQEISNSYGGAEGSPPGTLMRAAYNQPGVVIAAATGDYGYDDWEYLQSPGVPNVPASMPSVVSVGGTTLELKPEQRRETVWESSGGGCSALFEAPTWQRDAPGFPATGCGSSRLSADVAADADPETGFDIYDTYNCGAHCEEFIGTKKWSRIGGTSVSTPLISAMYALAGGSHGIAYPALTLYAHLEDASLFDVTQGSNGFCDGPACGANEVFGEIVDCEGTTSCNAAAGYDGPSGVGAPRSLKAFEPVPEEEQTARRRAEERAAAEEAARRAAEKAAEEAARHKAEAEAAAAQPKASSGQGGTAGFKAVQAVVPAAALRGKSLHAGRAGFVTVKVACPAGVSRCEGKVVLRTLSAVIAAPGARASVLTLAGGRFKVAGGHVVSVRLRLKARARALLARRGTLRLRVVIAAHDPTGASHTTHATATLHAFRRR